MILTPSVQTLTAVTQTVRIITVMSKAVSMWEGVSMRN